MNTFILFVFIVFSYNVIVVESQSVSKTTTRNPITIKGAATTLKPVIIQATTSRTTLKTTIKTSTKTTTKTNTNTTPTTTTRTTSKTTPTTNLTTTTKKSTTKMTLKPAVTTTLVKTTITAKPIIKSYAVCLDKNSSAFNGILYPVFTANTSTTNTPQSCRFDIFAPSNYQIQIVCPFNNASLIPRRYLAIGGIIRGDSYGAEYVITNRTYYSDGNSSYLSVVFAKSETFICQWVTAPIENTTDYKTCQQSSTTAPNGTIRSTPNNDGRARRCIFSITVPANKQQIQISCSVVNLATNASELIIYGIIDDQYNYFPSYSITNPPVLNRSYYSSSNIVLVYSSLDITDGFNCNWKTVPLDNKTTDFQLCRHVETTSPNGTIQPLSAGLANGEPPRNCSFIITAAAPAAGQQIQISCSFVNLHSNSSGLYISGVVEDLFPKTPVANRVYYSSDANSLTVFSKYKYGDSFNCKWTTAPKMNTTNFKLCRDSSASEVMNGTFQSLPGIAAGEPPRDCSFYIFGRFNYVISITMTCSVVNLDTSSDNYVQIAKLYSNMVANPPLANQVYTIPVNEMEQSLSVKTRLGYGDILDCKWTYNQNISMLKF